MFLGIPQAARTLWSHVSKLPGQKVIEQEIEKRQFIVAGPLPRGRSLLGAADALRELRQMIFKRLKGDIRFWPPRRTDRVEKPRADQRQR
jgi:hypothetical protein